MLALLASQLFGLSASRARAAELRPTLLAEGGYQSNAFGNNEEAATIRLTPSLRLLDTEGRLSYELTSTVSYLNYLNFDGEDFVETTSVGRAIYTFSPRTQLDVRNSFVRAQSLLFERQDTADGSGTNLNDVELNDQLVLRNFVSAQLQHVFTRNVSGSLTGSHAFIDFQDEERTDSDSASFGWQLNYALSARATLGVGGGYAYQSIDSSPAIPAPSLFTLSGPSVVGFSFRSDTTRSQTYNAFALLSYRMSRTLSFSLQGGPAYVSQVLRTEVRSVPVLPPGPASDPFIVRETSRNLTFFAQARAVQTLRRWRGSLTYSRRQAQAVGDEVVTAVDRVRTSIDYRGEGWSGFVQGSFSRRAPLTGDNDGGAQARSENYVAGVGFDYRLTPQLTARMTADYRYFQRDNRDDFENATVRLVLNYGFAPIDLELPF